MQNKEFKSGFVCIVGRPNVGKSTLLNALIGQKISIMTAKPQTTRNKIMGILNNENSQIIFTDTPGVHKAKHKLGKLMNEMVTESMTGVDLLIFIVEAEKKEINKGDMHVLDMIKESKLPCILVINKIDNIKREELLSIITQYSKLYDFKAVVPISALKNDGINILINEIENLLPVGPKYYDDNNITDQTQRQISEEIIREKALKLLNEEIPHGLIVKIESFKIKEKMNGEKFFNIEANIYCEKESHKGIIIGSKGIMLKKISTYARQDIEQLLGMKVNLKVWVKVKQDWRDNDKLLKSFWDSENH